MKKYAFLTCDDLSEFVVDDDFAFKAFGEHMPNCSYEVVSWSNKEVVWSNFDCAVIRTTWDYTKSLDSFLTTLKKIEDSGCKLLNPYSVVLWNSNKTYLSELERLGTPIVSSVFLAHEDEKSLTEKMNSLRPSTYVFKPTVGASADRIEIVESLDVISHFKSLEKPQDWFLQPFMKEVLKGEVSHFFFGGEYSHSVKKVPKQGDFRVQEEHGGLITVHQASESEKKSAFRVVELVSQKFHQKLLYARVDMISTLEGEKLMELELIEPSMYFRIDPESANRYIKTLKSW